LGAAGSTKLLGFVDDHWMVLHGMSRGEVLLANCLFPGRSSQWVSRSWLKPGLEPPGWGMIVSEKTIPRMQRR